MGNSDRVSNKMASSAKLPWSSSSASGFLSVIANVESVRTMVLVKRNLLIADLIKEIEVTYHELSNNEVTIKIVKNYMNAILPSWYPIEPLLKDGDEVFAFAASPASLVNFPRQRRTSTEDARNEDSGVSSHYSCTQRSQMNNIHCPMQSPGQETSPDQQMISPNVSEMFSSEQEHVGRIAPEETSNVTGGAHVKKLGKHSSVKRHTSEGETAVHPVRKRKRLEGVQKCKKNGEEKAKGCQMTESHNVETTRVDCVDNGKANTPNKEHTMAEQTRIPLTLRSVHPSESTDSKKSNEEKEEIQEDNKNNSAEESSSSESGESRKTNNNSLGNNQSETNKNTDDKEVDTTEELFSEEEDTHPNKATDKMADDWENKTLGGKAANNVKENKDSDSSCSDETYQKVKKISQVDTAISSIKLSEKLYGDSNSMTSDSAESSWSSSVDTRQARTEDKNANKAVQNEKSNTSGKDLRNSREAKQKIEKKSSQSKVVAQKDKSVSKKAQENHPKSTESNKNEALFAKDKTKSAGSSDGDASEKRPFTQLPGSQTPNREAAPKTQEKSTPMPQKGAQTPKKGAQTPKKGAQTPQKDAKMPVHLSKNSEKGRVALSASKVSTWLLTNDVTGVDVDTDVEESPTKNTTGKNTTNKNGGTITENKQMQSPDDSELTVEGSQPTNTKAAEHRKGVMKQADINQERNVENEGQLTNKNKNKKRRKKNKKKPENSDEDAEENDFTVPATSQQSQATKAKSTPLTCPKNSKGLSVLLSEVEEGKPDTAKTKKQPWWLEKSSTPPAGFLSTSKMTDRGREIRSGPGRQRAMQVTSSQKTAALNDKEQQLLSQGGLRLETLLNDETIKW